MKCLKGKTRDKQAKEVTSLLKKNCLELQWQLSETITKVIMSPHSWSEGLVKDRTEHFVMVLCCMMIKNKLYTYLVSTCTVLCVGWKSLIPALTVVIVGTDQRAEDKLQLCLHSGVLLSSYQHIRWKSSLLSVNRLNTLLDYEVSTYCYISVSLTYSFHLRAFLTMAVVDW